MTDVFITIDTELSAALFQAGADADANFARSIACDGQGVDWQMRQLEDHGLVGIFFVDPMPALVYGPDVIARIVQPIIARGHEVQLHLHPEWLDWAVTQPVGARRGRSIGDFGFDDQVTLLTLARTLLVDAGAPPVLAFRAGNYGANDDTLRALSRIGLRYDTSFNPAYIGAPCQIGLGIDQVDPVERLGMVEIPVSAIYDRPGHVRHAQICALSVREMHAALDHAAATQRPAFTIVTHSFEMRSRDRKRANRSVMQRFEALCHQIAADPRLTTPGYAQFEWTPPTTPPAPKAERLAPDYWRTAGRMIAQGLAMLAYER